MAFGLSVLLLALVIDRFAGDPAWIWSRIPHPVVWFGRAIGFADRRFNRRDLPEAEVKTRGVLVITVLVTLSLIIGFLLELLFKELKILGLAAEVLIVFTLLAQKSLADHVGAVAMALRERGVVGGREAVSMIVGRDTESLGYAGICRAAIESLAENFADGVVAPAFWFGLLGLPGLLAYKMINTADSMIGHKNERHLHFGWAAARLDDVVNYIPARISILLIALGSLISSGEKAARRALTIALRDHGHHRSPNSGWPEAAMAGALDIQLAGPRIYGGELVAEPFLNEMGSSDARSRHILSAIKIFYSACHSLIGVVAILLVLSLI